MEKISAQNNTNNPYNLEVDNTYTILYKHCNSKPLKVKITRFTRDGYPWGEGITERHNGIITDSYEIFKDDFTSLLNLNSLVIFHPTEEGWNKMIIEFSKYYNYTYEKSKSILNKNRTEDGGYKSELWYIISNFSHIFYNGSPYLKNSNIKIC